MGLFKTFGTDKTLEKTGIWLEYLDDENPDAPPERIRIAYAGGANDAFLKRMEALMKPLKHQIQHEVVERVRLEAIVRQVYADTVVLAWENVRDENGAPIAFSKENVLDLFQRLPHLYDDIVKQSQRLTLFRKEVREAIAGN